MTRRSLTSDRFEPLRPTAAALLLTLLAAAGGCAAAGKAGSPAVRTAPPSSPRAARSEIDHLERQIELSRRAMGLPARADATAGSALAPREQAPPPPPAEPPQAVESPAAADAADSQEAAQSSRMQAEPPDPCRHTRAICRAADRICRLANYLGEADARQRCQTAREDCREARRASGCDTD